MSIRQADVSGTPRTKKIKRESRTRTHKTLPSNVCLCKTVKRNLDLDVCQLKRDRMGDAGGLVVKLNDCLVRIIIDDSDSVNY